MNIEISLRAQKLIKKYWRAYGLRRHDLPSISSSVDFETFISWLNENQIKLPEKSKKKRYKIEFIQASLNAELLHDLLVSMRGDEVEIGKQDKNTSEIGKIKFALLTAAGILVTACQGFDSIVTMLSIFSLSSTVILRAGFAFSLLSIVVFCGFDLVKVSNSLGVKLSDKYKLLDAYLLQLQQIKAIKKKIDDYSFADLLKYDLKKLEQILSMLQKRFASLTEASKQFDEALNSENIQGAKTLISGVSALLFFGNGFFAGQSVALFVSSYIINSAIPAFWPVIIFSVFLGLASLSIYWYVERPVLNKLVSNWFGLNEENIKKLCDKDLLTKESKKLENLKEKVMSMTRLTSRLTQLEQEQEISIDESQIGNESTYSKTEIDTRASANFYSFLKPQGLLPTTFLEQHNQDEAVVCCSI